MDLGLTGRRAAVAAASAGLGLAAARALAAEGARVAICGRDKKRLQHALSTLGDAAVGYELDLREDGAPTEFVSQAQREFGGVDILVANNGGPPAANFQSAKLADYAAAVSLNLLSVVELAQAAVPAMQSAGWGRIVAITSIAVRQPLPNLILSNTARTGAAGFLKSLALEVAADGVTVNSLLPAFHATDRVRALHGETSDRLTSQLPVGRIGDPAEFGALVAFLCSTHAGFITGTAIPVDGGFYSGLL
jgi:3-oxoacyl-[acyl-carrier protein] reductase